MTAEELIQLVWMRTQGKAELEPEPLKLEDERIHGRNYLSLESIPPER